MPADDLIVLNLVARDVELGDIKEKNKISMVNVLKEQRTCFNSLVEALGSIANAVNKLSDMTQRTEFVETELKDIRERVIPEIKDSITRKCNVLEARLMERIGQLEKEKLLDEAHKRRLNLIVNGMNVKNVPRGQAEPTEQLVRELLVSKLKLSKEYVDGILFRDVHRLPKSQGRDGPPPVIMAFVLQAQRNTCLANAKELKGTNISLKSDLPKQLNVLRSHMLTERTRLSGLGHVCRCVERGYLPTLQVKQTLNGTDTRWDTILSFNKKLSLDLALHPVLPRLDIPVIDVEPASQQQPVVTDVSAEEVPA